MATCLPASLRPPAVCSAAARTSVRASSVTPGRVLSRASADCTPEAASAGASASPPKARAKPLTRSDTCPRSSARLTDMPRPAFLTSAHPDLIPAAAALICRDDSREAAATSRIVVEYRSRSHSVASARNPAAMSAPECLRQDLGDRLGGHADLQVTRELRVAHQPLALCDGQAADVDAEEAANEQSPLHYTRRRAVVAPKPKKGRISASQNFVIAIG